MLKQQIKHGKYFFCNLLFSIFERYIKNLLIFFVDLVRTVNNKVDKEPLTKSDLEDELASNSNAIGTSIKNAVTSREICEIVQIVTLFHVQFP